MTKVFLREVDSSCRARPVAVRSPHAILASRFKQRETRARRLEGDCFGYLTTVMFICYVNTGPVRSSDQLPPRIFVLIVIDRMIYVDVFIALKQGAIRTNRITALQTTYVDTRRHLR